MISKNGWTRFTTDITIVGGVEKASKSPYSRNLWRIMEKFQVLPSDPNFQNLTDLQVQFIMENMLQDAKEKERALKGNSQEYYEDEDDSWYNDRGEFDPLRDEDDLAALQSHVETVSSKESYEKARARFQSVEEWNKFLEDGGKDAEELQKEQHIQEQLEKAFSEAAKRDGISKESVKAPRSGKPRNQDIQKAIELFNSEYDDDDAYF